MPETSLYKPVKKHLPLTRIQKLIGQRMTSSKLTKPAFYIELKADVTIIMSMRRELRKSSGIKITTNTFYIRALALAAKKYPLMVAAFNGDSISIADSINVGFGVDAPQGLVVPVIKNADNKTLSEIAALEKSLTEKARSNKLTLEEIENETIALSNLGSYGIDSFIGIIPLPASAILGVSNVIRTIIPRNGHLEKRKLVSLSLAVDHRVINGTYAAEFLTFIKEQLQNPKCLI